jgi:hypothetical protein
MTVLARPVGARDRREAVNDPVSLALNDITAEDDLIDDLVNAPTLTNVYSGHPHLPSVTRNPTRRFLADFLTRNRGFIRD